MFKCFQIMFWNNHGILSHKYLNLPTIINIKRSSGLIQKGLNANEISSAISPYLLRRLKSDVLDELPDLIEENGQYAMLSACAAGAHGHAMIIKKYEA